MTSLATVDVRKTGESPQVKDGILHFAQGQGHLHTEESRGPRSPA
jgi:hypothetical protein